MAGKRRALTCLRKCPPQMPATQNRLSLFFFGRPAEIDARWDGPGAVRLDKCAGPRSTCPEDRRVFSTTAGLTTKSRDEIDQERKQNTDQYRCPKRKETRHVLASPGDIPRQPSQRQTEARSQQQPCSCDNQQQPE